MKRSFQGRKSSLPRRKSSLGYVDLPYVDVHLQAARENSGGTLGIPGARICFIRGNRVGTLGNLAGQKCKNLSGTGKLNSKYPWNTSHREYFFRTLFIPAIYFDSRYLFIPAIYFDSRHLFISAIYLFPPSIFVSSL